jgi:seryl-tRNA synthetase
MMTNIEEMQKQLQQMVTELEELKQSRNTPEETIQKISANGKF